MNAITLAFFGPLCGVTKQKPDVLHALTVDALDDVLAGRTMTAACGKKRVFFVGMKKDDTVHVALWPPRAKGEFTRCYDCWVATGKKRPRRARRRT